MDAECKFFCEIVAIFFLNDNSLNRQTEAVGFCLVVLQVITTWYVTKHKAFSLQCIKNIGCSITFLWWLAWTVAYNFAKLKYYGYHLLSKCVTVKKDIYKLAMKLFVSNKKQGKQVCICRFSRCPTYMTKYVFNIRSNDIMWLKLKWGRNRVGDYKHYIFQGNKAFRTRHV